MRHPGNIYCMWVDWKHNVCPLSYSGCKEVMSESRRLASGGFDAKTLWWPRSSLRRPWTPVHIHTHIKCTLWVAGYKRPLCPLQSLVLVWSHPISGRRTRQMNKEPFICCRDSISCQNLLQTEAIFGVSVVLCIAGAFRKKLFSRINPDPWALKWIDLFCPFWLNNSCLWLNGACHTGFSGMTS